MKPINEQTLDTYARHMEQQAKRRALSLGHDWCGAPCEHEFFLAAMTVFVFMEAHQYVPDAWVDFLNPEHPRKSVVQPDRKDL